MSTDKFVLGLNYRPVGSMEVGHHPAAALLKNGQPVAMCQEERFVRIKEAPGAFPIHAIQYCLKKAGITIADVDAIGWNWDPARSARRRTKGMNPLARTGVKVLQYALRNTPLKAYSSVVTDSVLPERVFDKLKSQLLYWLGVDSRVPLFCFDHHRSHAASAYYPSGFENATVVTWDAWGDHLSGLIGKCHGDRIEVIEEIPFSQFSIGALNDFVYAFLRTSEKGNLMGLAPYGKPNGSLDGLVDLEKPSMRMDLLSQYAPFPESFLKVAGQPRRPGDPLEDRHKDLAADLQRKIEAIGLKVVRNAVEATGERNLCMAGGCALNATLNGKIGRSGLVDGLFIQPEAGDAGGALGAAYLAHLERGYPLPRQQMQHAYWGPSFTDQEIVEQLDVVGVPYEQLPEADIPAFVSELLVQQKIVGWFQLGCEWGPRALGARSIIADPRREDIRDRVNLAVKYRDWWRPFAPSMLTEAADEYLEGQFFAPFMLVTFPVKEQHRPETKGVTHLDGTTRPQMVVRDINPKYYDTIARFGQSTGVPMILNTSFNLKGEPIVNTPRDALRTFFSSGLDALVMNNVVVRKAGKA
jgi:carbamoyltransferase